MKTFELYNCQSGVPLQSATKGKECPSVRFTDDELRQEVANFTPNQLRALANVYEGWAQQCRFKADLMECRLFSAVQWIKN